MSVASQSSPETPKLAPDSHFTAIKLNTTPTSSFLKFCVRCVRYKGMHSYFKSSSFRKVLKLFWNVCRYRRHASMDKYVEKKSQTQTWYLILFKIVTSNKGSPELHEKTCRKPVFAKIPGVIECLSLSLSHIKCTAVGLNYNYYFNL